MARAGPARIRPRRVSLAAAGLDRRHVDTGQRSESDHAVHRHRAALDPALRAVRYRDAPCLVARVGAEVFDHRLGRFGDAGLRPRAALRRDGRDRLLSDRELDRRRTQLRRAASDRRRAGARRTVLQGVGRAVSPVDTRCLRGRADADHGVHGGRHQGRRVRSAAARLRRRADRQPDRLGPGAGNARDDHDHRRQRRRARPVLAEADARLLVGRAGGLHHGRCRGLHPARRERDDLLSRRLPADEPRRLRRDHRP